MANLLIVWHSRTGTARSLAEAVFHGAQMADAACSVSIVPAASVTTPILLGADGYVFACPENLASMSGEMKEMVDRSYYDLLDRVAGRPVALIVAAGNDGEGTVRQWRRILTGWRMKLIADPVIVRTGAETPQAIAAPKEVASADLAAARDLGAAFASGLAMGLF